jgi:hypothetical protein
MIFTFIPPPSPEIWSTARFVFDLVDATKKDIIPPLACCPTHNGPPPQSGSTKTQQDKECTSTKAAKALAASEKKLASEAKKLAVKGLQEKKKQLPASCKTERNAIKVAALQKIAAASVPSTPGSALSKFSGICLHFPKKSRLTLDHLAPSDATASLILALSPQHKGNSPKKRAQLNQALAFPRETLPIPNFSPSGSWKGTDDKLEEDPDSNESEEKDSINCMVSNWSAGWTLPLSS